MTPYPLSSETLSERSARTIYSTHRGLLYCLLLALIFSAGCVIDERQSGIPEGAQATIASFTEDFNADRFDKIYREAAEEWRARVTAEQSNQTFRTLKERMGQLKERTYTSGKQQQASGNNPSGASLIIRYNARFERAEGMETFTLIEREGRHQLAGYSVSSNALQQ